VLKVQWSRWRRRLPVGVVLGAALGLFPHAIFGQATKQYPRSDFQGWTDFAASHPLSDRTEFQIGAGLRYGNDQGHLIYRRISSGFAFHWHKLLTLEPYYQYSVSDSLAGPLTPENRLAFATTVGTPWKRWYFSDRNLGERRFLVGAREWRYRNRLELRRTVSVVRKELSVFAWDEVYYSSLVGRWYRNRLAIGAGRRLNRRLSIDLFYVHQNDGYSHPGNLNGLGLALKTRF
jgi:hypothetical protein